MLVDFDFDVRTLLVQVDSAVVCAQVVVVDEELACALGVCLLDEVVHVTNPLDHDEWTMRTMSQALGKTGFDLRVRGEH